MHDLIVIGAGPAGSSAAITAARNGAQVLLLEKSRFPRHKVCGEFTSAESLELLFGLLGPAFSELRSQAHRISTSRIFLDGRVLQAEISPPAASIARFDLDFALWTSALASGVETREQVTVKEIKRDVSFSVLTTEGTFKASAVIDASGRWSNLTAKSLETNSAKWLGLKGHFAEEHPPGSVDLYFFDGGYCGVQPVKLQDDPSLSRVNACAMVRADAASRLEQVFALHPALRERSTHWEPLMDPVTTSPLLFHEPAPLRGNILLTGDAAAFVDPFVGDGISLALRGGATAAHSLKDFFQGSCSLEQACERYRLAYGKNLARVYWASSRIRRMLRVPRSIRKPFVFLLEKNPALNRYLVRKTR